MDLSWLFEVVRSVNPADKEIFLVGGAVRDFLLGQPVHDLDFALGNNTRKIARGVARELKSPFYMLDDQRQTARVIFHPETGGEFLLDFVVLVNNDLETDLRLRDFTINAMAINLNDPQVTIDLCGGLSDLRKRILRVCSPNAMINDPLRIIRGVRFLMSFGLALLPETQVFMTEAAPLLEGISAERKRDELFRILEGPTPEKAIRILDSLGGLDFILPELSSLKEVLQTAPHKLDVWEHSLLTLRYLQYLLSVLENGNLINPFDELWIDRVITSLSQYKQKINDHFSRYLVPGRSLQGIILLAALYHDIAKPITLNKDELGQIHNYGHEKLSADIAIQRARELTLSHTEIEHLGLVITHHLRVHLLAKAGKLPTRRSIYRFFRDTADAGIDICLLSLADTLATYGSSLPLGVFENELNICCAMLSAWWDMPEQTIHPSRLMNGDEIKIDLNIEQGPLIGKLLELLREAQASGEINNLEEAHIFIRTQYKLIVKP